MEQVGPSTATAKPGRLDWRVFVLQWKLLHDSAKVSRATIKTWCSQINKSKNKSNSDTNLEVSQVIFQYYMPNASYS